MIALKKLASLSSELRMRKIRRLCGDFRGIIKTKGLDSLAFYRGYISNVMAMLPGGFTDTVVTEWGGGNAVDASVLVRGFFTTELRIEGHLGEEAVDWDFAAVEDRDGTTVLPLAAYLEDLRSPFNVGSVFRTAAAFGFGRLYVSPDSPSPSHPRARRSSMGTVDAIPWNICSLEEARRDFASAFAIEGNVPVFGLETGGAEIGTFSFPSEGIVVLGSEEMGIHPLTLEALGQRRVSIPLYGPKGSLNVGVAFGILAREWTSSLEA